MTFSDLHAFCSQDPHLLHLATPFHYEGWSYATCGRQAVRLPTNEPNSPAEVPEAKKPRPFQSIQIMFLECVLQMPGTECHIPTIPPLPGEECTKCEGSGYSKCCPKCKGTGEIECCECGQDRDCPKCDGHGRIPTQSQSGLPCGDCHGTGTSKPLRCIKVGSLWVSEKYLAPLLPQTSLKAFVFPLKDPDHHGCLFLTFEGGQAIIMPMARPAHDDITIE